MKILIGLSGGVDSAVSAHMLKSRGYDISCAMMKIYNGKVLSNVGNSCYGADKTSDIKDARAICEFLDCDFHLIDVSCEFNELVFSNFKSEYQNARTPNPCTLCNPLIKFGAFPNKAKSLGIDYDKFATGHYVRSFFDETSGKCLLKRGVDPKKDQSYFLWGLKQQQLMNIIFPLGEFTKAEIRQYAINNSIPVAAKTDSQDFYSGSYSDLIDAEDNFGDIVDIHGNILGQHSGLHKYTIGQRKGLLISYSEPLYVVGFDTANNRLIVDIKDGTYKNGLFADGVNLIHLDKICGELTVKAKIRSSQIPFDCTISQCDKGVRVNFLTPQSSVAPGQSVVFYDDDIVLGGGIIQEAF